MTWTDITWATGEVVDVTRINAMTTNATHVRNEASVKYLVNEALAYYHIDSPDEVLGSLQLKIDDVNFGATSTTGVTNISIAGVADSTIHTLTLVNDVFSVSWRFYKTPDINYISWWGFASEITRIGGDPNYSAYRLKDVTIIGHVNSL